MRYSVSSLKSPCVASPSVEAILESLELRAVRSQLRSINSNRRKESEPAANTNLKKFLMIKILVIFILRSNMEIELRLAD